MSDAERETKVLRVILSKLLPLMPCHGNEISRYLAQGLSKLESRGFIVYGEKGWVATSQGFTFLKGSDQ